MESLLAWYKNRSIASRSKVVSTSPESVLPMDMSLAGMVPALMLGMAFAKVGRESLRGPALLPAYELGGGGGGAPQVAFGPGAVSCTALSANRRFFSIEIIRISAIIHPVR